MAFSPCINFPPYPTLPSYPRSHSDQIPWNTKFQGIFVWQASKHFYPKRIIFLLCPLSYSNIL